MKKGFTLIEMLVVIGIIAILIGVSIGGYSVVTRRAQQARGRELVSNVATALNVLYQRQHRWPPSLLRAAESDGILDEDAAACLAVHNLMSLSYQSHDEDGEKVYRLSGFDRFGIVTPWAMDVIKHKSSPSESTPVPTGGTIGTHRLHFALDTDGDGLVELTTLGENVKVRGTAAVWCWGPNGKQDDKNDSMSGRGKADDIFSWTHGQEAE